MSVLMNRKKILTGMGLFAIHLQCPRAIEAGGTARFTVQFFHQKDGPVNPSSLTAKVYEGHRHATTIATLTPIQDQNWGGGKGAYFAEWDVPATQGSGPYTVVFNGTYVSSDDTTNTPRDINATIGTRVTNPWR